MEWYVALSKNGLERLSQIVWCKLAQTGGTAFPSAGRGELSPVWESHEIGAFLFPVGVKDGRLQCSWAAEVFRRWTAGFPGNWCKWLASKLRLPACVSWSSCLPRVKTEQQEVAPVAGTGSFYWCKVPPNGALCRMLQNHTVVQSQNLFSWCALPSNSSSAYPRLSEYQAIVRVQFINTQEHLRQCQMFLAFKGI